jgi:adenine-specific DNA-methyltransferase
MTTPKRTTGGTPKSVETIRHTEDRRVNIPTAEHQSVIDDRIESPIRVAYERRNRDLDPQLVWRGKDEQDEQDLVVWAPPLYIQEKVHPKYLVDDLLRESKRAQPPETEIQATMFADFNGVAEGADRTDFYQHDANWTNRMILGDSLQVMASLAEREGLRGKVQCIYIDPPYGIKFNSNFQWSTTSRDVKDGNAAHITREPEQVKAFRDTWRDGIHSYLTYLRERLEIAHDLLSESGSIFVQIGDENVHRVRALMDEVFGEDNFCSEIFFAKTTSTSSGILPAVGDLILWYARAKPTVRYRQLLRRLPIELQVEGEFRDLLLADLTYRKLTPEERASPSLIPSDARLLRTNTLVSPEVSTNLTRDITFRCGKTVHCGAGRHWKTGEAGLLRLEKAERIDFTQGPTRMFRRHFADNEFAPLTNVWTDTRSEQQQVYVVQTKDEVIKRCILMSSNTGDLVLDPTCGSGTTAYVAEQWGRRWITVDTSRVALALARARIMGARYPYYLLADSAEGQHKEAELTRTAASTQPTYGNIRHGFVYERVPHIELNHIANNTEIDVIWERWEQALEPLRGELSVACGLSKTLEEWEVPREAPANWPQATQPLLTRFWEARIARQKEIDASIAVKAEYEYLYDRPYEDRKKVRVAGPFTVESVSPHRMLGVDEHDELFDTLNESRAGYGDEAGFAEMILENLRLAGVQQAHKEDRISFTSLVPWPGHFICGEGRFAASGKLAVAGGSQAADAGPQTAQPQVTEYRAGIFIGPEFGTVSRPDLVEAAREAADAGFDVLIACAFNYDAHSAEFEKLGRVPILKARMNADLHMADDLKNTGKGNLFVIFGEPDIEVVSGLWLVTRSGREVSSFECVKELSGLGSLEEINRFGGSDLPGFKQLFSRRTVRADEPGAPGGGLRSVEHRGGSGTDEHGGVPPGVERGERIAGGSGDAGDSGGQAGDAGSSASDGAAGTGGRDQQNAGWAQALAGVASLTAADFPLSLTADHLTQVTVRGVDVFHPNTGEVRSDGPDGIACWFIDTDYNAESFFVRQAYFLGANDPYKSLKTTLKAEINEDAWATLHSDTSRAFPKPAGGRIAVKVINHLGDEVMKVFRV